MTGVSYSTAPLEPKRLALLHELVPPRDLETLETSPLAIGSAPLTNTMGMSCDIAISLRIADPPRRSYYFVGPTPEAVQPPLFAPAEPEVSGRVTQPITNRHLITESRLFAPSPPADKTIRL
jgi:hypothetical protein